MNPIKYAKEFTTLSAATAVLKVSTLSTRRATSEVKEASRILQTTDDFAGAKESMKHMKKGMKYAKNGKILRNLAFQIHPRTSK